MAIWEENKIESRIEILKARIESAQSKWRNSPQYDGSLAADVYGMIKALNIITDEKWGFENGKLVQR